MTNALLQYLFVPSVGKFQIFSSKAVPEDNVRRNLQFALVLGTLQGFACDTLCQKNIVVWQLVWQADSLNWKEGLEMFVSLNSVFLQLICSWNNSIKAAFHCPLLQTRRNWFWGFQSARRGHCTWYWEQSPFSNAFVVLEWNSLLIPLSTQLFFSSIICISGMVTIKACVVLSLLCCTNICQERESTAIHTKSQTR